LNSGRRSDIRALNSGRGIGHSGTLLPPAKPVRDKSSNNQRLSDVINIRSGRHDYRRNLRHSSRHDFLDIAFAIDKAFGIKLPLEKWTQEVNDGKATTEQYFVLKNLSARIDELVAAKGA
jgi:hypothetical protein